MTDPVALELVNLDRVLADWVLDRVSPEEIVNLAVRALEQGCTDRSIARIAGLAATRRADIEDEIPRVLAAFSRHRPTADEALKIIVDDDLKQIASGQLDPIRGALRLWSYHANEDESVDFSRQVKVFIGHTSECDQPGPHVAEHRAQIIAAARTMLLNGGLRLPPATRRLR